MSCNETLESGTKLGAPEEYVSPELGAGGLESFFKLMVVVPLKVDTSVNEASVR